MTLLSKRLLTFDFLRGFSIMCIVIFHLLLLSCVLVSEAESNPFSLPIAYLIITVFVVLFAHWRGLFLIISSVVNIYVMTNSIRNGGDRKKVWLSQLQIGFMLWIFGMIREVFLNEWSIPAALGNGNFIYCRIFNILDLDLSYGSVRRYRLVHNYCGHNLLFSNGKQWRRKNNSECCYFLCFNRICDLYF